jgi:endonuclease III
LRRKVDEIIKMLDEHFPNPPIPLDHEDPYTLLIAVLLSAQCTDKRVNIVTKELFIAAKSPQEMIKLSVEEIEVFIKTCGLFRSKAKAILELSHILIDKFSGIVPNDINALETLPGVGHKTASVVMTQCFNTPAFPVDTHIHRCAMRWGLSSGKNVVQTEKDMKDLFPKNLWGKIHLQIIYYARSYCPAKKHNENECTICNYCNSTNTNEWA